MDKLARLEAEANRRSTALAAAASRFARRFDPLRLTDEALGRLGPASDIVERASLVSRRYPWATAVFALSAAFLAWQYLRTTEHLASTSSRRSVSTRRRTGTRKLPAPQFPNPNQGDEP
jgi:hypothetical protein